MELRETLTRQFGKPKGKIGHLIGWSMAVKNRDRNLWAIEKMDIQPNDKVLEIGFGPGSTLKLISEKLVHGLVVGVDHSDVMYSQAVKRNIEGIKNNKVELLHGSLWDLLHPENSFDKILASNVHFFWKEPEEEFNRLKELLKPGGKLYLAFQPRWAKSETEVRQIAEQTRHRLVETGFPVEELTYKKMRPVTCIFLSCKKL